MKFAASATAFFVAHAHRTLAAGTIAVDAQISATTESSRPLANNQRTTLRGRQYDSGNHQSLRNRRKLERNKAAVRKLIHNLAERKKKEQTIQTKNVRQENSVLDLGVIGKDRILETSDRADKASIFDQNSVREPSLVNNLGEDADELVDSETVNSTSFYAADENENTDEFFNSETTNSASDYAFSGAAEENNFFAPNSRYLCQDEVCNCENFDFESTQGSLECSTETVQPGGYCATTMNYCGEQVELCYRETVSLEAVGPQDYTYTTCTTYTQPYQQHVCVTFESSAGDDNNINTTSNVLVEKDGISEVVKNSQSSSPCSVQFNNEQCNSCSTEIRTYERNFVEQSSGESYILSSYQSRCFQIDCSNAAGKDHFINTCDTKELATLRENIVFGDDCTRCPPCGVGYYMTDGNAIGNFPMIGTYQCSGLELGAMIGFFDRDLCRELQSKATEYCGCEPIFYDSSLILPESYLEDVEEGPGKKQSDIEESRFNNRTANESQNGRETEIENMFLLPGDTMGAESCHLCGANSATIAKPNNLVELPNGMKTTCSALEGAGRLGMMTSDYCKLFAMPLAFSACGGCSQWGNKEEEVTERAEALDRGDETSTTQSVLANDELSILQDSLTNGNDYHGDDNANTLYKNDGDYVEEESDKKSNPTPRLIDVVSSELNDGSIPNSASPLMTESSGSMNSIIAPCILMIPVSLLVYFS